MNYSDRRMMECTLAGILVERTEDCTTYKNRCYNFDYLPDTVDFDSIANNNSDRTDRDNSGRKNPDNSDRTE